MIEQFLSLDGLILYDSLIKAFIESKIFIGTYADYKKADEAGLIKINTLVIITDDATDGGSNGDSDPGDNEFDSTSSMLGYAILGQMVLG